MLRVTSVAAVAMLVTTLPALAVTTNSDNVQSLSHFAFVGGSFQDS